MRAAFIDSFNSKLTFGDFPDPSPMDNEVCVAVEYAGVNPVDAKIAQGLYANSNPPYEFPIILGWEVSGRIRSLGKNATSFNIGDPVFFYCRKPIVQWGSWAELITYPAEQIAHAPKNATLKEAAGIPLAGLTAWQALFEKARLKPDESILIHGAGGGVGTFAIQWAKYCGASPIIVTASPSKTEYVKSLGADEVINYKSNDFVEAIQKAHPFGIDVVLDAIGKWTYKRSFEVLKPGGRIVSLLEQPAESLKKRYDVEAHFLFVSPNARELETIASIFDRKQVILPEIQEFNFEEAPIALRQIGEGHTKGKLVLNIGTKKEALL